MYRKSLFQTIIAVLTLFVTACNAQSTSEPVSIPTETLTPIHLTETPTLTPTPVLTSTPTVTPTSIGGKDGLLLNQVVCPQSGECAQTIYLYDLVSHELVPFMDGYTALDVSPDGNRVLLKINPWETGNLFILDLAQPEQITLFQENVDDAAWLGDSGWIGFISKVNGIRQVFLVHPDGNDLTQVTNSSVGAVKLEPVFNDGVFWGEGTIDSNGSRNIRSSKWTKLDGVETEFINFDAASHSGKYVITFSFPMEGKLNFIETSTGIAKEVSLSKSDPNIDLTFFGFQPLSDDKWLIEKFATSTTDSEYWIYSPDGTISAKLPNEYRMVDDSDPPSSYRLLSPDGIWILVSKFEKISDEQFNVTYHLFNTITVEIQDLPNLYYTSTGMKIIGNRRIDGDIEGSRIDNYFWVEIP